MMLTLLPLWKDGPLRIRCEGHLTSAHLRGGADPLENLLGSHVYGRRVLLDLELARSIDSSGICWLLHANKRSRKAGGRLVLYRVPPLIGDMLSVLRLSGLLLLTDDEESACAVAQADDKPHPERPAAQGI
jgi:anti-anti-sigma regulatory factor